tara:strand:- start:331 stop:546 length:216 start_codon:yes stop_codon:yes gene_type:complete
MEIAHGDIIQITNLEHPWFPALMIVDEVKTFGCQAYAHLPSSDGNNFKGQAYLRLETDHFEKVGTALHFAD